MPLVLESTKQKWLLLLKFCFRLSCIALGAENSSFPQPYSQCAPKMFSRPESRTPGTLITWVPFLQRASLEGHKHLLPALVTQLYQECSFLLILTSAISLLEGLQMLCWWRQTNLLFVLEVRTYKMKPLSVYLRLVTSRRVTMNYILPSYCEFKK